MKYLIVDDEPLALSRLKKMLQEIGMTHIISATNGKEAIELAEKHHPHVIFLDIEMPVMRGVDAAKIIRQCSPESKIIFSTAYDAYAIEAFELSATDYLLKPFKKERLLQALDKIAGAVHEQTITYRQGGHLITIGIDDVYCLLAEDKVTIMYCQNGEVIIDASLLLLESQFSQHLLRINRNALINKNELCGIRRVKSDAYAKLKSIDYQPQISRRNLTKIKELLI